MSLRRLALAASGAVAPMAATVAALVLREAASSWLNLARLAGWGAPGLIGCSGDRRAGMIR